MNNLIKKYDAWLDDNGPAALVLREHLMPVEGQGMVSCSLPPLLPARTRSSKAATTLTGSLTVAASCLVDSVGSQANRIEPLFMKKDYVGLVPQIVVKAGSKKVNLLEAGHRAGDAIVRCSELQKQLQDAFKAVLKGNAEPLAKIAPTSLVFGVWDSRDTQAKLPRLADSKIRAFNVRELTRSAQYAPPVDYGAEGLLEEPGDLRDAEGKVKSKHPFAQRGFVHVPASGSHGGVIATGGIRRDATLHLAALRLLAADDDVGKTLGLRRYILGLALTALTCKPSSYLRQGCNLVSDPDKPAEFKLVFNDGRRDDASLKHEDAVVYAKAAVGAFGKRTDQDVDFDPVLAKKDVGDAKKKTK